MCWPWHCALLFAKEWPNCKNVCESFIRGYGSCVLLCLDLILQADWLRQNTCKTLYSIQMYVAQTHNIGTLPLNAIGYVLISHPNIINLLGTTPI